MNYNYTAKLFFQDENMPVKQFESDSISECQVVMHDWFNRFASIKSFWFVDRIENKKHVYNSNGDYMFTVSIL